MRMEAYLCHNIGAGQFIKSWAGCRWVATAIGEGGLRTFGSLKRLKRSIGWVGAVRIPALSEFDFEGAVFAFSDSHGM